MTASMVLALLGVLLGAAPAPAQVPGHLRAPGPPPTAPRPGQDQPQPPSHKWWQNPRAAELGLTVDQSKRIEEIFQATLPTLRTCNSELEKREARLNAMLGASDVSEADVSRLVDLVEASRSEMSKARTLMLWRMNRVLTPEQRERVKAMYEQWERDRRRPPDTKK